MANELTIHLGFTDALMAACPELRAYEHRPYTLAPTWPELAHMKRGDFVRIGNFRYTQ